MTTKFTPPISNRWTRRRRSRGCWRCAYAAAHFSTERGIATKGNPLGLSLSVEKRFPVKLFLSPVTIEDIQIGMFVYSYNAITGETELAEVTAVLVQESNHLNYLTVVDESSNVQVLEVSDVHPFWVVGVGWVEAKGLQEWDVFLGANDELVTVVSIDRVACPEGVTVYNFTVDGNHNYFVIAETDEFGQTSVLGHNTCGVLGCSHCSGTTHNEKR